MDILQEIHYLDDFTVSIPAMKHEGKIVPFEMTLKTATREYNASFMNGVAINLETAPTDASDYIVVKVDKGMLDVGELTYEAVHYVPSDAWRSGYIRKGSGGSTGIKLVSQKPLDYAPELPVEIPFDTTYLLIKWTEADFNKTEVHELILETIDNVTNIGAAAEQKGVTAANQGAQAEIHGNYAKDQGNFAKTQGDAAQLLVNDLTAANLIERLNTISAQLTDITTGDTSAIDSYNEMVAVMSGLEDTETIKGIFDGFTAQLATKANKDEVYTKGEVNAKLLNYSTKEDTAQKVNKVDVLVEFDDEYPNIGAGFKGQLCKSNNPNGGAPLLATAIDDSGSPSDWLYSMGEFNSFVPLSTNTILRSENFAGQSVMIVAHCYASFLRWMSYNDVLYLSNNEIGRVTFKKADFGADRFNLQIYPPAWTEGGEFLEVKYVTNRVVTLIITIEARKITLWLNGVRYEQDLSYDAYDIDHPLMYNIHRNNQPYPNDFRDVYISNFKTFTYKITDDWDANYYYNGGDFLNFHLGDTYLQKSGENIYDVNNLSEVLSANVGDLTVTEHSLKVTDNGSSKASFKFNPPSIYDGKRVELIFKYKTVTTGTYPRIVCFSQTERLEENQNDFGTIRFVGDTGYLRSIGCGYIETFGPGCEFEIESLIIREAICRNEFKHNGFTPNVLYDTGAYPQHIKTVDDAGVQKYKVRHIQMFKNYQEGTQAPTIKSGHYRCIFNDTVANTIYQGDGRSGWKKLTT